MTRVAFAIARSVAPCIRTGWGSSTIDDAFGASYIVWGEVRPSNMVTKGAAGDGRYAGEDTTDAAVAMEEAMLVCPDLIEAVSEPLLVTSGVAVAIMDVFLKGNEGELEFNIDMPRELSTLLAALRL
jgi:hypothetical protein